MGTSLGQFPPVLIGFCIASMIGVLWSVYGVEPVRQEHRQTGFRHLQTYAPHLLDLPSHPLVWHRRTIQNLIITIGAFVPAVINSFNGIRLLDPSLYDVVRMSGGSRRHEISRSLFRRRSQPSLLACRSH